MKTIWASCMGAFLFASAALHAQETTRFAFDLGAGFTTPLGNTGRHLDDGWGVKGGAGINFNSHVGLMMNLGFDSLGINDATLGNIGLNSGNIHVFSARLDPVVHVGSYRHADFYVTAGGGFYHLEQEFGGPAATRTAGVDPFFGFYSSTTPASGIQSSYSVNKPGVDGGIGVAFGSKWHGKFFAEARYNRIFSGNDRHVDYLPVTLGFRW